MEERIHNAVKEHKHEGADYWHPVCRNHYSDLEEQVQCIMKAESEVFRERLLYYTPRCFDNKTPADKESDKRCGFDIYWEIYDATGVGMYLNDIISYSKFTPNTRYILNALKDRHGLLQLGMAIAKEAKALGLLVAKPKWNIQETSIGRVTLLYGNESILSVTSDGLLSLHKITSRAGARASLVGTILLTPDAKKSVLEQVIMGL